MAPPTLDPAALLADRFRDAIARAFPDAADADPSIAPTKQATLGDFQCNAAMGLAKRVGRPPREIADAILRHLDPGDLIEPPTPKSVAGPGFINLTLSPAGLARLLDAFDSPALGVPAPAAPQTVVVDLCGVNLAKEMHVGHLRSTIIGDAVARTFARLGHRVVRQNHLGDWGLPIAMVTGRLLAEVRAGRLNLATVDLGTLERHYRAAQRECNTASPVLDAARTYSLGTKLEHEWPEEVERVERARAALADAKQTLVRLQRKEPETIAVWQRVVDVTIAACARNCERLHADVRPEDTAGESSYADELGPLVQDVLTRGVATVDAGAVVIRLDAPEDGGITEPCLIRKSDGGFLYATTDLAGIRRRVQKLGADRVVYCVDARQSLHFRQVFAAARKAGYTRRPDGSDAILQHAAFGMVLGEDKTPLKTRSGENVKLADLIDQAQARALAAVNERSQALPEAERRAIAEVVGVAAVKYTDLSVERIKDYVFSVDRMVAFEGNTGPYLLYALARIKNIFRKAEERGLATGFERSAFALAEPTERALAIALLRYPGALASSAESCEPSRLCQYLYELAGAFSAFYTACHVLDAPDDPTRLSRLRLAALTARVLADGLGCLGIRTVERM